VDFLLTILFFSCDKKFSLCFGNAQSSLQTFQICVQKDAAVWGRGVAVGSEKEPMVRGSEASRPAV